MEKSIKSIDLSKRFFDKCLLRLIRKKYSDLEPTLAAGVLGMGSDTSGLDDEHSRDHHWGPRCNIILPENQRTLCIELESYLIESAPQKFEGYEIYNNKRNRIGITVETVSNFFENMIGISKVPILLEDWFNLTEADLFHVTKGKIFVDGEGDLTRLRKEFSYYPEIIWRKKIADWLVYITGHGVYNIKRGLIRKDFASANIYYGVTLKRVLEMGHLLNRSYAPYNKWLYRNFKTLNNLSAEVIPLLENQY